MLAETPVDVRQRHKDDFQRPRYHFLPPANWMNDPNGFIHWRGEYHLFYQYNPDGAYWANMHWGHAASPDLVYWRDLPLALAPTPNSADARGIFSGCMVDDNSVPTIFYTGAQGEHYEIQSQCIATGDDSLRTWTKHPRNPILATVPPESGQTADFRDPFVWREDDAWYMAVGSQIKGVGGTVFLYRSHNLTDWEYLNPLYTGDLKQNGVVWECPNFFKLGDAWVLIVSAHTGITTGEVLYFVGDYDNHRFTPFYETVFDYGHLYAPLSTLDAQNRRVIIGWLREARSELDQQRSGWSGVQSIPRILTLDDQRRLCMQPVSNLEMIRGRQHHYEALALNGETPLGARGQALDIEAMFTPGANGRCGIAFLCASNQRERVEVVYDHAAQTLTVRKINRDPSHAVNIHTREMPHTLDVGEPLHLRILLDGSVIETIANGRTSVTSRYYSTSSDHDHVALLGANATLDTLDLWEMPSIW
jgi:beta-fructofuranosidase